MLKVEGVKRHFVNTFLLKFIRNDVGERGWRGGGWGGDGGWIGQTTSWSSTLCVLCTASVSGEGREVQIPVPACL